MGNIDQGPTFEESVVYLSNDELLTRCNQVWADVEISRNVGSYNDAENLQPAYQTYRDELLRRLDGGEPLHGDID